MLRGPQHSIGDEIRDTCTYIEDELARQPVSTLVQASVKQPCHLALHIWTLTVCKVSGDGGLKPQCYLRRVATCRAERLFELSVRGAFSGLLRCRRCSELWFLVDWRWTGGEIGEASSLVVVLVSRRQSPFPWDPLGRRPRIR